MNTTQFLKVVELLRYLLADYKGNIYLVGGCVRDQLLGHTPKDIDLCIDLYDGVNLISDLLKKSDICKNFVEFPRYKTGKFTLITDLGNFDIECVVPRSETYLEGPRKPDKVIQCSVKEDSLRRDFCCNALYQDLWDLDNIIDPTNRGIEHCKSLLLETTGIPEEIFRDDPLRMLRGIRFCCTKKGFRLTDNTLSGIKCYRECDKLSAERIRDEFSKIINSNNPRKGLRLLYETGLLKLISQELVDAWVWDQRSKYHSMTLGEHLISVLEHVIEKSPTSSLELRLAALFHDISKYQTFQIKEVGDEYSFYGHELSSADLAENILTKLKYPTSTIKLVKYLIKEHMALKQGFNLKRVRKLVRHWGSCLDEVLLLIDADNMCHAPKHCLAGQVEEFRRMYSTVTLLTYSNKASYSIPITGNNILEWFPGKKPGRWVRSILDHIQDLTDEDPELTCTIEKCRQLALTYDVSDS